ncbi:MAG: SMP-30/gluconolactonase/LRE family protein [Paraglaciecola sp.]|nr:SMP-30/gluconolactonase/LRE family protein [Paraglaciecola sp.]
MYLKNLYVTVFSISAVTLSMTTLADEAQKQCQAEYVPITSQHKLRLVDDNFYFLEGPTWSVQNKAFYFSEMNFNGPQEHGPKSTIYQLNLPNKVSIYKKDTGTNGLLAIGEFLYTMNHATRSLSRLLISSTHSEIIVNSYHGLKFNSPNDLVQSHNGTIYFTDPDWQLSGRKQETPYTGLYALSPKGTIKLLDSSIEKPNGIALSPDQKTLYVGSFSHDIVKYQIDKQGNIGDREAFISINSPDGMAIDCAGNIYATSHSEGVIYVYSSEGEQLDKISVGPKVTNIAFGGEYLKTLLITTNHGLYTIEVNISGFITLIK